MKQHIHLTNRHLVLRISLYLLPLLLGNCREECVEAQPSLVVSVTSATVKSVRWDILDKTVSGSGYTVQSQGDLVRDKRTEAQLPLNLNATQTRYTLQADGGRVDTLTVRYKIETSFVSQKCGYALSAFRPAQGMAARFTRDTLKGIYFDKDSRPASTSIGYYNSQIILVQLGL